MTTAIGNKHSEFSDGFARELRAEMARRNVSGRELARRIGESSDWVSRRTRGLTPATAVDMQRLAEALGCSLGTLLERSLTQQYVERKSDLVLGKKTRSRHRSAHLMSRSSPACVPRVTT